MRYEQTINCISVTLWSSGQRQILTIACHDWYLESLWFRFQEILVTGAVGKCCCLLPRTPSWKKFVSHLRDNYLLYLKMLHFKLQCTWLFGSFESGCFCTHFFFLDSLIPGIQRWGWVRRSWWGETSQPGDWVWGRTVLPLFVESTICTVIISNGGQCLYL